MAYNPNLYMPYGQQSFAQPTAWTYPPAQTTAQAAQPINGLVSVTGIEGAKAYPPANGVSHLHIQYGEPIGSPNFFQKPRNSRFTSPYYRL